MFVDIKGLDQQLGALAERGDAEGILRTTFAVLFKLVQMPELAGRGLFQPVSDRHLQMLANAMAKPPRCTADRDSVLHIATEVYDTGGHTRILEDMVAALPDKRHTLVLTDIVNRYHDGHIRLGLLEQRFHDLGIDVVHLRAPSLTARMHELQDLIAAQAPHTIFLNVHHFDSIAYAAVSGQSAPRVHFLHHCDYQPSLGPTRTDYEHVDLTVNCHQHCCTLPGVSPRMLYMTVKDSGPGEIDWSESLRGVTSGAHTKYRGRDGFSYIELVVALLGSGLDTLHHIGDLPTDLDAEVRSAVMATGCDPARFVTHGNVPSLSAKLKDLGAHFYLNSHPVGGMKALIEAMTVGLPFVHPQPAGKIALFDWPHEAYGTAHILRSLDQTTEALAWVRREGAAAGAANRAHYIRTYEPAVFHANLRALVGDRVSVRAVAALEAV